MNYRTAYITMYLKIPFIEMLYKLIANPYSFYLQITSITGGELG